ncbi:hypothetical protein [Egicoccus halophilus]|nr:hypothetical protein [Egicoccus halophilus]
MTTSDRVTTTSLRRHADEHGIALPTALLAMLVLLMLSGLFVAHAAPQEAATADTQAFEAGLHVAESAAELAVAALADPNHPAQPFTPAVANVPTTAAGARQWALGQAAARVTPDCRNFERTANGDGIAILDQTNGDLYGVAFLPDCRDRRSSRVVRMAYDVRPVVPLAATVSILTGCDVEFAHTNAQIGAGGIHSNCHITGFPRVAAGVPYTASGSCDTAGGCAGGQPKRNIPNYHARVFWQQRNAPGVAGAQADPFYELCPDGSVRQSTPQAVAPCNPATSTEVVPPSAHWVFTAATDGNTWTWTSNAGPPNGQYYAYQANVVNRMNNGNGNSTRITLFAEADRARILAGDGRHSGNITYTENPKFFTSWPGVGAVADVDLLVDKNMHADGQMTLMFAREQFRIDYNGRYDRLFFMTCDAALDAEFRHDSPYCETSRSSSTPGSPIHRNQITKNSDYLMPPSGNAIVPNLGISGVTDWEAL